jgi:hypothetical protein
MGLPRFIFLSSMFLSACPLIGERRVIKRIDMESTGQPADAPNPARGARLHAGHQWRGSLIRVVMLIT